jgi:hypothetical protein
MRFSTNEYGTVINSPLFGSYVRVIVQLSSNNASLTTQPFACLCFKLPHKLYVVAQTIVEDQKIQITHGIHQPRYNLGILDLNGCKI